MPLTLMYITNHPEIAQIAQKAGVDRIWVDMEYIGKEERQGGMDTVKSRHTIEDVRRIRQVVKTAQLMVRINPIHEASEIYMGTEKEVEEVIQAGADVIMLPMFKRIQEVERFIRCVDGRATVMLLLETAEAAEQIDEILKIEGIDEIHIGLNDLHLAYRKKFMFELLCDGTVHALCKKIKEKGIKFGFGGIARVGYGMLPAEFIMTEHYALGSTAAILSRGFCDANRIANPADIADVFYEGVANIRKKEKEILEYQDSDFLLNHDKVVECVKNIVEEIKRKNV